MINISELYKIYSEHFLVDTDTRKLRKNTIFFALKGVNFDGNTFAENALEKGANYSIVDQKKYKTTDRIILVDNVLETLQKLAQYHRKQLSIPIIAITGSNGKTTTKQLVSKILNKKYNAVATSKNLNNHIGVPLTLLSMTPNTEIGIVEMGANHPREIEFLCSIVRPDFGYITNFGKAHLEGFGSIEGVIESKSELYTFLKNNDKIIFVNPKDKIQVEKTKNANTILFDFDNLSFQGANPFVALQFKNNSIQSQLIGNYNFNNIASAITIGNYFQVSFLDIKQVIEKYIPNNNRSQVVKKNNNTIILDAYNANPTSMKAALENFNMIQANQKTVILGDMFELGKDSIDEHQHIINYATSCNFDKLFFIGNYFYQCTTKHPQFKFFEKLVEYLKENPIENHFILIKGSRSMALERLLTNIN